MAKSKFFRVAVEGATTDGRTIERDWLTEMAATYDREKYGARVFIEHIRGLNPEWGFRAMGDVLALKAEEITDGALKGKMALYAQIEPTAEMVSLVKSGQKIYSSMEINPNFAETGKKYLDGLGITDSPASLGTEVLTFAAQHPDASPFKSRKRQPGNMFSAAELSEIQFEDEPADTTVASLFTAVKEKLAKLAGKGKTHDGQFAEVGEALQGVADTLEQIAASNAAVSQQFATQVTALTTRLDAIEAANKTAAKDFSDLRGQLEAAPGGLPRPAATGGADTQLTDC
jgi:hypothetical protein